MLGQYSKPSQGSPIKAELRKKEQGTSLVCFGFLNPNTQKAEVLDRRQGNGSFQLHLTKNLPSSTIRKKWKHNGCEYIYINIYGIYN
jgi:hypothetical protein